MDIVEGYLSLPNIIARLSWITTTYFAAVVDKVIEMVHGKLKIATRSLEEKAAIAWDLDPVMVTFLRTCDDL